LRFVLAKDGSISQHRTEPLAADARSNGDGRHYAKLKLLAGLLAVDYDALRRREHERQRQRLIIWSGVSAAVSLLMAGLAATAIYQRREAQAQRTVAEKHQHEAEAQQRRAEEQQQRAEASEHEARRRLAALYEERGREELSQQQPERAAPFLAAAYAEAPERITVKFLLGAATQELRGRAAVLSGHLFSVLNLAYNRDGSRLATADGGGTVKVWDLRSGEMLKSFERTLYGLGARLLFHPNKELLFLAGGGKIWICDLITGQTRALEHGTRDIHDLALSADGTTLISASEQYGTEESATIKEWNVSTGQEIARFSHGQKTLSARLDGNGRRLLTTGDDGKARVWDWATRKELFSLPHRKTPAMAIWSPDDQWILTAGTDSGLAIWDGKTGHQASAPALVGINPDAIEFNRSGNRVLLTGETQAWLMEWPSKKILFNKNLGRQNARFSPDGNQFLLFTPGFGPVEVRSADDGRILATFSEHGTILDSAFSPDSRLVALASKDRRAILWEWALSKTCPPISTGFDRPGTQAIFGADGLLLAKAAEGPRAGAWLCETGAQKASIIPPGGNPISLCPWAASRKVTRLATAGADSTVRVWDYRDGRLIQTFPVQMGTKAFINLNARSIDLSADAKRLITTEARNVHLWDVDDGRLLRILPGHFSNVIVVKLSPAGDIALVWADSGITGWSTATGAQLFKLEGQTGPFNKVFFSQDGSRILTTARDDKSARLWDAANGKALGTFGPHAGEIELVSLSSQNKIAATYGGAGSVLFWDCENAKQIAEWQTPQGNTPSAIAFWPRDNIAAIAVNGFVFYVDARTGVTLYSFNPEQRDVSSLDFNENGDTLLTAGWDGTIRTWPLNLEIGSPAQIQARLEQFGSWLLVDGHLVPLSQARPAPKTEADTHK
jgi:WD40 repeat protein